MKEKYINTYIDTSDQSKLFSEMYKTILFVNPTMCCFICKIYKESGCQLPLPKGKGLYLPPKAEIHWNCLR
jgi:hypothetical protein